MIRIKSQLDVLRAPMVQRVSRVQVKTIRLMLMGLRDVFLLLIVIMPIPFALNVTLRISVLNAQLLIQIS